MEIKEFYNEFISRFNRHKRFFKSESNSIENKEWTEGISNYIKKIFEQDNKYVCICKNSLAKKGDMQEFLGIDFTVFNNNNRAKLNNLASQLMLCAIEHENNPCCDRIAYNISKLLNIKAENKIMIGYIEGDSLEKQEEEKEKIFNEINTQLKIIPEEYFREKEKLLVILGVYGMEDSSGYSANLYYLKSKRRKKL